MDNMIAEAKHVEQTLRHLALVAEQATQEQLYYRFIVLRHLVMVAEQAVEGIVVADLYGIIRFVNTAWARMHGYENKDELVGKPIGMFHSEQQMRVDVIGFIEEAKNRGQLEGPIEHLRRDGTAFPTQTKMVTAKDEQGKAAGLIVFAADVSSSSQAEELLKQQTIELKAAKEQLPSQIAECHRLQGELQQCRNQLEQITFELKIASEELQKQTTEHERAENKLRQYCISVEQQTVELAAAINKVIQFADSGAQAFCNKTL